MKKGLRFRIRLGWVRWVGLYVLPIVVVGSGVMWVVTWRDLAMAEYRFGRYYSPGEPGGNLTFGVYKARTVGLVSHHGRMWGRFSQYTSIAVPTRDELDVWRKRPRWSAEVVRNVGVRPRPMVYWNSVTDFDFLGLAVARSSRQGDEVWGVSVPYWLIGLGAVGVWLWCFVPLRRRRRRRLRKMCEGCGYDLAGLGEGAPCPECGKVD